MKANELKIKVVFDDALPQIAAVVNASIKLHDCQIEFDGLGDSCAEHYDAWDSAVETLKKARSEANT